MKSVCVERNNTKLVQIEISKKFKSYILAVGDSHSEGFSQGVKKRALCKRVEKDASNSDSEGYEIQIGKKLVEGGSSEKPVVVLSDSDDSSQVDHDEDLAEVQGACQNISDQCDENFSINTPALFLSNPPSTSMKSIHNTAPLASSSGSL